MRWQQDGQMMRTVFTRRACMALPLARTPNTRRAANTDNASSIQIATCPDMLDPYLDKCLVLALLHGPIG